MSTGTVILAGAGEEVPAFVAEPSGATRGGIVVIQEAFGVNEHVEDVCRRFAGEGWHAVAPHLFHRIGDPVFGYEEYDKILPAFGSLDGDHILSDVDASLSHLAQVGLLGAQCGIVGYCMGGIVSFFVAVNRPIGGAVSYYGSGISKARFTGIPALIDVADSLHTPWLGLFGDLDQGIPVEDVEALRERVGVAAVETEIVRYAQAGHGFNCDKRDSYHAASAEDAWGRTLAWLDGHVARP